MQQRRLRLGDILDDYCPRERRITNHAVVAMIDDEVKQTRCTTCDADHEYKQARVPAPRRKKDALLDSPDADHPMDDTPLMDGSPAEIVEALRTSHKYRRPPPGRRKTAPANRGRTTMARCIAG